MTTDTVGMRGESGITGTALRALFERLLLSKERDDRPELAGRGARDNGDLLDLDMDLRTDALLRPPHELVCVGGGEAGGRDDFDADAGRRVLHDLRFA